MSFKRFLIKRSGGPCVQRSGNIYAILVEGIIGNIHVKLFYIWTSGSGGDVIYRKSLRTTDSGRTKTITIAHHEPTAQELKSMQNHLVGKAITHFMLNGITLSSVLLIYPCMLGNFAFFFVINRFFQSFSKNPSRNTISSVKQFGSNYGPTLVKHDLAPKCLQSLSAENKNCC